MGSLILDVRANMYCAHCANQACSKRKRKPVCMWLDITVAD